jgi:hypothetical protein
MIDDILRTDKDFKDITLKIGLLTLKDETKEYLKSNLSTFYENRKKAEEDVIKYSLKVLISLFIYLILMKTGIESISLGFVSIKDISMIKLFFPIVILYYALLMSSVDLFRVQNIILHHQIQAALYPDILLNNLQNIFIPFSFINLISKSPSSNKYFRIASNFCYRVLFLFIAFSGFIIFLFCIKYGYEKKILNSLLFISSIFIQLSICLLTVSVFIRKLRLRI